MAAQAAFRTSIVRPFAFLTALIGAACSGGGSVTATIEDVREVDGPAPGAAATSDQRFGFAQGGHGPGDGHDHGDPHGGNPHGAQPSGGGAGDIQFTWVLPEGWEEVAPTSMRQANFRVAGDPSAECYLTLLPGGAGGVEANVNRWRGQLGLDPLSMEEIDALPREILVRGEAVFVDMVGDYRGMGSEAKPDYRMAGLILEAPSATLFLKMVGPSSVIDGEIRSFLELGASFDLAQPDVPASSANSAQGLAWQPPDGWLRGRERSMRLVTFTPEGTSDTECYVTVLPGEAGGVAANMNRWRSQMGQAPYSEAEIAGLERRDVLGAEAVFIEIDGDFTGMSGGQISGARFLGMVCNVGSATLFVKMTGPAAVIDAERDNFYAFCDSLAFEGS